MKIRELITHLKDTYKMDDLVAASIWTIDDVIYQAESNDTHITRDQCNNVLTALENNHDATIGINWDTIDAEISNELWVSKQ